MFWKQTHIGLVFMVCCLMFGFSSSAMKRQETAPYDPPKHFHTTPDKKRLLNIKKPFYLMRHGRTKYNESSLIQGHLDIPLDEIGKEQAQKAGEILRDPGIKIIFSSFLSRAKETATIVRETIGLEKPITIVDALVERGRGEYEGKPSNYQFPEDYDTKEKENNNEAHMRYVNVILDIAEKNEDGVLIVTHRGLVREFIKFLGFQPESLGNAVPYRISPPKDEQEKWKVEKLIK